MMNILLPSAYASKVAYIANNMDPEQTKGAIPSGFIMFASMIKSDIKANFMFCLA